MAAHFTHSGFHSIEEGSVRVAAASLAADQPCVPVLHQHGFLGKARELEPAGTQPVWLGHNTEQGG